MKKLLCATLLLVLPGCLHPTPGAETTKKDPYAVARTVIQGAQLGVLGADGVFEMWASGADPSKVTAARDKYTRVRAAVVAGLAVALDGVNIAESQKAGFDLNKLMAPVGAAWADLRSFLTSLGVGTKPTPTSAPIEKYTAPTARDLPGAIVPK